MNSSDWSRTSDPGLMSPQSTPEKLRNCTGHGPESSSLRTEAGDFTEALALISRLPLSTAEKTKAVRPLLSNRRVTLLPPSRLPATKILETLSLVTESSYLSRQHLPSQYRRRADVEELRSQSPDLQTEVLAGRQVVTDNRRVLWRFAKAISRPRNYLRTLGRCGRGARVAGTRLFKPEVTDPKLTHLGQQMRFPGEERLSGAPVTARESKDLG